MLDVRLSTILFQALNFVILLVLLQRFLYRPLLKIMRQREATVAAALHDAEQQSQQAADERKLLAAERAKAQAEAEQALAQARAEGARTSERLLADAQTEVARRLATAEQRTSEQERAAMARLEQRVVDASVAIASNLIRQAAGPVVHQALLADLQSQGITLPDDRAARFREALRAASGHVIVELAYPPPAKWREDFRRVIEPFASGEQDDLTLDSQVNPALIAGIRLNTGMTVIDLSLAGTLRALSAAQHLSNGQPEIGP